MNGNNIQTQPTLTTRIKDWWNSICLFTKVTFIGIIAIFLIQTIASWPETTTICYSYPFVIGKFQIWRILTAPFFHGSFLHIVFNMFALVTLGLLLERKVGTVNMFVSTALLIVFCGLIQMLITFLAVQIIPRLFDITQDTFIARVLRDMLFECGVGFSGVLFAYMVIAIHYDSNSASQPIFGFAFCPVYLYPWFLLLISSLLMVGVSFFGHFAGLIAGYILVFLLMKRNFYNRLVKFVESKVPQRVSQWESFIVAPNQDGTLPTSSNNNSSSNSSDQAAAAAAAAANFTFSTSTSHGRVLGRASGTINSAVNDPVAPSMDNTATDSGSSFWSRARDMATNAYQRVTGAFTSSSGGNGNNSRNYAHLQEEEEDLELPAPATIDPSHAISIRRDDTYDDNSTSSAKKPDDFVASDNSSNQQVVMQQAPPSAAQPQAAAKPANVDDHFKSLSGGRKLGNA